MATVENLRVAFAGESQANRTYLAFAAKAEEEGFPQVARLFRAAAAAETVHAHAHLAAMGGVKSTLENLQAAIDGEGREFTHMYPPFVEEARKERHKSAERSFSNALAVEKIHYYLYARALTAVKEGEDLERKDICVCEVCGNTVLGEAPDTCPICRNPQRGFTRIE